MKWISTASLLIGLSFELTGAQTFAQQPPGSPTVNDLSARLEQQDREIQQLQAQINGMQRSTNAMPAAYAPALPAEAPKPASEPAKKDGDGYVVGTDLNVKTFFKDGEFLNFETPHKDFTMHLGGYVQWDNTWWTQPTAMKTPQGTGANAAFQGAASGGIGTLEDGDDWRRIRIVMEGNFWDTYEYRFNFGLENVQFSTVGLDDFWIGDSKLPWFGNIRAGHIKTPMGLEGDMTGSSRAMTFMERSSFSEAIELNQKFGNSVWLGDSFLDDRGTWAASVFHPDNGNSGDFFGTNELGLQARITMLPIYEENGRHLLHFAVSGGWRDGANNLSSPLYTGNTVTLSARPELVDDDPAAGASNAQPVPNTNDARMVSTGPIACTNEYLTCLEALYINGPFSFQAEYGWNWLDNAQSVLSNSTAAAPKLAPVANYMFDGGYVQLAYTLTGENRAYDKKYGILSRYYLGSKGPYDNAFLSRDENGCWCSGTGAWEAAARYSYIDLNAGSGASRINGGIMDGLSVGLNWYLNSNLTIMNEVSYNNRYDVPASTVASYVRGIGTRLQLQF